MPQFLIHILPSVKEGSSTSQVSAKSSKNHSPSGRQSRGHVVALIDCQQIVREPVIAPESCAIVDPTLPDPLKQQHELLRTRAPLEVTQLSEDSGEHSTDARALLLEKNLLVLTVTPTSSQEGKATQTLEVHFNNGLDRFFLIGLPCKLMLEGLLRLHSPTVDAFFGFNLLTVTESTMIYVHSHVVDVYGKIDAFEHVANRRRLAYDFYGKLPMFESADSEHASGNGNHPEYVVYFSMDGRRRPVALYIGQVTPCQSGAFKPLDANLYPKKTSVVSTIEMMLVMNDARFKDRRQILGHSQLATITVRDKATCHVCSLTKAVFSFAGDCSLKLAGYLAIRTKHGAQLVPGRAEVIIKAGSPRLYLDDHFAVLEVDSDAIHFEVEQSNLKQKELRSISLMNTNLKLRQKRAQSQGTPSKTSQQTAAAKGKA